MGVFLLLFFNRRILHLLLISISSRQAGYLGSATTSLPKILHSKVWGNVCKENIWRMSLWSCITKVGPSVHWRVVLHAGRTEIPSLDIDSWTSQTDFSLEISDPGSSCPLYERQTLSCYFSGELTNVFGIPFLSEVSWLQLSRSWAVHLLSSHSSLQGHTLSFLSPPLYSYCGQCPLQGLKAFTEIKRKDKKKKKNKRRKKKETKRQSIGISCFRTSGFGALLWEVPDMKLISGS